MEDEMQVCLECGNRYYVDVMKRIEDLKKEKEKWSRSLEPKDTLKIDALLLIAELLFNKGE